MPWFDILWDHEPNGNVEHIAEHGVSPEELRQVLEDPDTDRDASESSGQPLRDGLYRRWAFPRGGLRGDRRFHREAHHRVRTGVDAMVKSNRYRNVNAVFTAEERKRYKTAATRIDREEQASIRAQARRAKARIEMLRDVLNDLKAERQRLGLSLADVSARSGIDKAALSRLENAANANPKLDTLVRYAQALGLKLRMQVTAQAA